MNKKIEMELEEGLPYLKVKYNNGIAGCSKTVSISSFSEAFLKNSSLSTGILPIGARFFIGSASQYCIGIETSPMVRTCNILSDNKDKIPLPFPPCLFIFFVKHKRLSESFLFALKSNIFTMGEVLYKFPYGNVHSDGYICWGDVHVSDLKSCIEVSSAVHSFFNSEFNSDLFDRNINFKEVKRFCPEWSGDDYSFENTVKMFSNLNSFPVSTLIPLSRNLSDIINK